MIKFDYLVLILLGSLAAWNIVEPPTFMLLYVCVCCYTFTRTHGNSNIQVAIVIICTAKLFEYFLFPMIRPMGNYIVYPTYLLLDSVVIILLMFRVTILRKLNPNKAPDTYFITKADMTLGGLYLFYMVIDAAAFIEHCLRHLDDFGAPANAGYVTYLFEHARFVYSVFPYLKHTMNIFEIFAVWLSITNWMRSARMLSA